MAQQLEILKLVRPALRSRNDVVQGHVLEQVVITASVADALLLLIEVSPRMGRNSCLVSCSVPEDAAAQLWDERRSGHGYRHPNGCSSLRSETPGQSSTLASATGVASVAPAPPSSVSSGYRVTNSVLDN